MADDEQLPELLSTQAQAIVDRAKSLGLTWTLRPATAQSVNSVIYDADTVTVGVISFIGTLTPGDRVMMLQIPPGGNYVIGFLGTFSLGRGVLTEASLTSSSGSVGTSQTIMLSTSVVTFTEGRAYAFQIEGGVDGNTTSGMADIRIYKGTTTATTIFEFFRFPWTTNSLVVSCCAERVVRVATATTTAVSLGLSATVGTTRLFVANNTPFVLRVVDVGPGSDYPLASAMP